MEVYTCTLVYSIDTDKIQEKLQVALNIHHSRLVHVLVFDITSSAVHLIIKTTYTVFS